MLIRDYLILNLTLTDYSYRRLSRREMRLNLTKLDVSKAIKQHILRQRLSTLTLSLIKYCIIIL
jgi:hypothetical protein